jgi:hypothetical protein
LELQLGRLVNERFRLIKLAECFDADGLVDAADIDGREASRRISRAS